jgi:hypothetical protein
MKSKIDYMKTSDKITDFLDSCTHFDLMALARVNGYEELYLDLFNEKKDLKEASTMLGLEHQFDKYIKVVSIEKNIPKRSRMVSEYETFLLEHICLKFAKDLYQGHD